MNTNGSESRNVKKLILPIFIIAVVVAACSPTDPNEIFVQGKWTAAGDLGDGHSWYLEWTFDNGSFEMVGYPPIHQAGKYRLTASEGDTITLELYDQQGDLSTADRTIVVVIDSVSDKGVGISPDQLAEMTVRFKTSVPKSLVRIRMGVGLYIVQYLVQAMNGQIGITSEPGKGSTFWFTLPVAEEGASTDS